MRKLGWALTNEAGTRRMSLSERCPNCDLESPLPYAAIRRPDRHTQRSRPGICPKQATITRILIIEDDPNREARLKSWLPADVRAVVAASAGKAIGILRRDSGLVYAGIVLDFDLQLRRGTASDLHLSGRDVALAITEYVSRDVQILVHSENTSKRSLMVYSLRLAGFDVTQVPMHLLTADRFCAWLAELGPHESQ